MPVPGNRPPGSRPSRGWQMPGVRRLAMSYALCGPLSGTGACAMRELPAASRPCRLRLVA